VLLRWTFSSSVHGQQSANTNDDESRSEDQGDMGKGLIRIGIQESVHQGKDAKHNDADEDPDLLHRWNSPFCKCSARFSEE
jgi:hypothetical protein